MITVKQIEDLSKFFQIDRYSVFREYLQLLFLSYLYQHKQSDKIYFKGGTAIHLLLGSPRFSEDLDFASFYKKEELKLIIKAVEKEMRRELSGVKIPVLYQGKKSIRFRLKFSPPDFKYPFAIRIDFQEKEVPKRIITSSLVTNFPLILFPVINHFSEEEILAEKIAALLTRIKGRDIFDLWFLLEKKIKIDKNLLEKKLRVAKIKFDKKVLLERIAKFSDKKLKSDLNRFLPQRQRQIIKILKPTLLGKLEAQKF